MRVLREKGPVDEVGESYPTGVKPGAATLTQRLPVQRKAAPSTPTLPAIERFGFVQAYGGASHVDDRVLFPDAPPIGWMSAPMVQATAAEGTRGASTSLPHLDTIQPLFGQHDVSSIRAHTDVAAAGSARAIGAEAYAQGDHVAFAGTPTLHTAAHEAAHVIQQRGGVALKSGVGQEGDAYERHADAVADLVVRGESAAALLDQMAGTGPSSSPPPAPGGAPVMRKADPSAPQAAESAADPNELEALIGEVADEDPEPTPVNAAGGAPAAAAANAGAAVASAPRSGGAVLPSELRTRLERELRADLSGVRIHTDPEAARATKAVAARAFARGQDIYFAEGAYDPHSEEGQRLIAHEVAHTVQQPTASGAPAAKLELSQPMDSLEQEADAFAEAFVTDDSASAAGDAHDFSSDGPVGEAAAGAPGLLRYPDVVAEAMAEDRIRLVNPQDPSSGHVWEPGRGYMRNPTAGRLDDFIRNGRVTGRFQNGTFMYVVDGNGDVILGTRQRLNMPHPTLIGGENPTVQAAGMVEIRGGRIVRIDNHSGHFRPPRSAMSQAVRAFMRLPRDVFQNFRAESVHFDDQGRETRRAFRSLRTLRLRSLDVRPALRRIRNRYRHDPRFRGRVRGIMAGGLAIVVRLLVDYLFRHLQAMVDERMIRSAIERLGPRVQESLTSSLEARADEFDALHEQNADTEVFMNVVYRISYLYTTDPDGEDDGYMGTTLESAEFSTTRIAPGLSEPDYELAGCGGGHIESQRLSVSESITLRDLYEAQDE